MGQDLRELFKQDKMNLSDKMKEGHESRFLEKLGKELPVEKKKDRQFYFLKIAASVIVIVATALTVYHQYQKPDPGTTPEVVSTDTTEDSNQITLGNISPELKKIENYYLTNINIELSQLEVNEENKQLFDAYLMKLNSLNEEYNNLNKELNEEGLNEQTINAMIDNLQIRLQFIYKLKEKLNELKETRNETFKSQQI